MEDQNAYLVGFGFALTMVLGQQEAAALVVSCPELTEMAIEGHRKWVEMQRPATPMEHEARKAMMEEQ